MKPAREKANGVASASSYSTCVMRPFLSMRLWTFLMYELWRSVHGFTASEFREINLGAIGAAFCDEDTKAALRSTIARGWAS